VPILVVLPGLGRGCSIGARVETTQIAPTILSCSAWTRATCRRVQSEHTRVLPGLRHAAR
jgi:hypothetical protein